MEIDYRAIGSRVAQRRRALRLRQYEVCERIGVNDKYLSNIETARSVPSLDTLLRLCEVLETSPDYLLLGRYTEPSENGEENRLLEELEKMVQRYKNN